MSTGQLNLSCQSAYTSAPKFSFQCKPEQKDKKTGQPGPGKYNDTRTDKDKFFTQPRWSMGSGVRDDGGKGAGMPGPGSYKAPAIDPRYNIPPRFGFGSEARLKEAKPMKAPGPAHYETRGGMEGMSSSMAPRPEGTKRGGTPGPGSYPIRSVMGDAPKLSFGSGSRADLVLSKTPGPGTYPVLTTLGGNCVMKSPGKYSMKFRQPPPPADVTPGPPASGTCFGK